MKIKMGLISLTLLLGIGFLLLVAATGSENNTFSKETPPVFSPDIPADVSVPDNFQGNPIDFFDDYSWRAFIALVWPAKQGERGVADPAVNLGDKGRPLVFETYKNDWELFHADGSAPEMIWNKFGDPVPCNIGKPFGFEDMALVATSKFGNLGQAGVGNLVGPIIAQNKTYVRYLTSFNEIEFNKIIGESLYLQANLGNPARPLVFDNGAIDIKTSWIIMDGIPHPERYYTRKAWVFDLVDNKCSERTVGLIGMHIVQKTASRPQWIWSTFEHIDNIPQHGSSAPFALNDGTGKPMPANNPVAFPPPDIPPAPFNIERNSAFPIHPKTQVTNTKYQQLIKDNGNSVWQFYQLAMTQWPTAKPPNANLPGTPQNTFPGNNPTSSFTNITMETFDQKRIQSGCMNCHTATRFETDFLWALKLNAFPSPLKLDPLKPLDANINKSKGLITDKAILRLESILRINKNK